MAEFIPYGRQQITDDDVAAVVASLRSNYLTTGPAITAFEDACKSAFSAPYAVALCNATAALHVAYLALDLGEGDVLWTVPNTFLSTANAARLCGADVDFVDIDPTTFNMDVSLLEEKLKTAKKIPKIVAPVHFAGQSCDMEAIWKLSKEYGFYVVEDAAHAVGGFYQDKPVGNCEFSHAAIFSFHPVKIVTTAEGGVITTRDKDLAERMARLRSHGMQKTPEMMQQHGGWYYEMDELGLNYRMTDMQAALGASQMKTLPANTARRREVAANYQSALASLPFNFQTTTADAKSAWHLFVITCANSVERRALYEFFQHNKVGVQIHYIPVHTQPYYQKFGFKMGDFPVAEDYYNRCISLPMFHSFTNEQQQRVIGLLAEFAAASRTQKAV